MIIAQIKSATASARLWFLAKALRHPTAAGGQMETGTLPFFEQGVREAKWYLELGH